MEQNIFDTMNIVDSNLSSMISTSNESIEAEHNTAATINLNGSYMFEDEDSMNSLLNQIGLAVQRQGG